MNRTITRRFRFPAHASVLPPQESTPSPWSPGPLPSGARAVVAPVAGNDRPSVSIIRATRDS